MKHYLKEFLYSALGALIVGYILYVRLLRDTLPTNLRTNLFKNGNYFLLLFYFMLFLIFLLSFIIAIRTLLVRRFGVGRVPTPNLWLIKLSELYAKSLETLGLFIMNHTPIKNHLFDILTNLGLFLFKNKYYNLSKTKTIIVIAHILPKSIFLGAFIVDVMIFHQFFYIYKVSFLMLIPLIETFFHYLFITFCKQNLIQLDEIIFILDTKTKARITAEKHSFNLFAREFQLELPNLIDLDSCVFEFTDQFYEANKNKEWDEDSVMKNELNFYYDTLIPIIMLNSSYSIAKNWSFSHVNFIFYLSYACIWSYILVYSW